jgi:NAD(P)-dependent dehydrogenase (short-subunit alcohol dehydrogenase family)
MGYQAALATAKSEITIILVARNPSKLEAVKAEIMTKGGNAQTVVCDFSNLDSVKAAANAISLLNYKLVGLANNAGTMYNGEKKSAQGYDLTFATDYLGPFLFSELMLPLLSAGARVEFTVSAVEDPERKFATRTGFRGGRFLSIEKNAQGIFKAGGAKNKSFDAYATSKQCLLAATLIFAKAYPELKINALEPGLTLGTSLGMDEANAITKAIATKILPVFAPLAAHFKYMSSPKRAGNLISKLVTTVDTTGIYYNEKGEPMQSSQAIQNDAFCEKIVRETRDFLK